MKKPVVRTLAAIKKNSGKFDFTSADIIRQIREKTDTVLLAFSGGKDSIAAWIAIRPHFKRIVPIFRYGTPGLKFVENTIDYYEEFFDTKIIRLVHPSFYKKIGAGLFQAPGREAVVAEFGKLGYPDYEEVNQWVREDEGLSDNAYIASGARAFDSTTRYMFIKKYGAVSHSKKAFYPIFDWKKDQLIKAIEDCGCGLPIDYQMFGRSFDGVDMGYIYKIRERYPEDYERIKLWYPLIDAEIMRYGEKI